MLALTYSDYLAYAKAKGFQPVSEKAFNSMRKAGFSPIANEFRPVLVIGRNT